LFRKDKLDLIVCHMMPGRIWAVSLYEDAPTWHLLCDSLVAPCHVEAIDLDGDGHMDLVVAELGSSFPTTNRTGQVVWLRGDGKADFVALISQEHEIIVAFLNEGKGRFTKKTIYEAPHPAYESSGIQLVDLNGDGALDVLYTNGDVLNPPYLLKPYQGIHWLE